MRYEYFARNKAEDYAKNGLSFKKFPEIELYMDQFVSCLNKELELFSEEPITKGMVSNYVKHKMLPNPEGKKYKQDHFYFMLLIYYLKNLLSMEEIQKLMKPLLSNYNSEWEENIDISKLYGACEEIAKENLENFPLEISKITDKIKKISSSLGNEDDTAEIIVLILSLSMQANANLFLIKKLLKEYFTEDKK